jgi:hypothetical protein
MPKRQVFRISNPMHAEKRMQMRLKIEYSLNGSPVLGFGV